MCDGCCGVCMYARRCSVERALEDAKTPAIAWPPRMFTVAPDSTAVELPFEWEWQKTQGDGGEQYALCAAVRLA